MQQIVSKNAAITIILAAFLVGSLVAFSGKSLASIGGQSGRDVEYEVQPSNPAPG